MGKKSVTWKQVSLSARWSSPHAEILWFRCVVDGRLEEDTLEQELLHVGDRALHLDFYIAVVIGTKISLFEVESTWQRWRPRDTCLGSFITWSDVLKKNHLQSEENCTLVLCILFSNTVLCIPQVSYLHHWSCSFLPVWDVNGHLAMPLGLYICIKGSASVNWW